MPFNHRFCPFHGCLKLPTARLRLLQGCCVELSKGPSPSITGNGDPEVTLNKESGRLGAEMLVVGNKGPKMHLNLGQRGQRTRVRALHRACLAYPLPPRARAWI